MRRSLWFVVLLWGVCATARAASDAPNVEKCDEELGSLAVVEPQSEVLASLSRYSLRSPSVLLRLLAQESGCFAVVERGVAIRNIQQERALSAGGQLQEGSNVGGGQLQVADFVMTPAVQFSDDTGGIGGAVGGLLGRAGGLLGHIGGLAGGVKFKEAETSLLVADVRSGIQVASAEGKATKMNLSIGGWGWGGLGWASGAGYTKTPEGKLIAASLLDNYNNIVQQIRSKPTLIRTTVRASNKNAAQSIAATGTSKPAALPPPGAPAPTPVAAPALVSVPSTSSTGTLATGAAGAFSGQFEGADVGVFSVIVTADGVINGVAQSTTNGTFTIGGRVTNNGMLSMTGAVKSAEVNFVGLIDAKLGAMVGTWSFSGGTGTFSGRKPGG